MKLKDLFEFINANDEDIDVYVDGIDGIAVCAPIELTKEGKKHFADALKMEVKNYCVMGNEQDYEDLEKYEENDEGDGGRLMLAWQLLKSLAGYCACDDFEKWFNR